VKEIILNHKPIFTFTWLLLQKNISVNEPENYWLLCAALHWLLLMPVQQGLQALAILL